MLVVVVLAHAGACLLTTPLDKYTSGSPHDGGAPADGGLSSDADREASDDRGACDRPEPTRLLCADFDRGAVADGWSSVLRSDNATQTIGRDGAHSVSAPSSAEFRSTTSASAYNLLLFSATPPATFSSARFAAWVYVDAPSFASLGKITVLGLSRTNNADSVSVRVGAGGVEVDTQRGGPFVAFGPYAGTIAAATWTHLEVEVHEKPAWVSLVVDGKALLTEQALADLPAPPLFELRAGLVSVSATARLLVDDVTLFAIP